MSLTPRQREALQCVAEGRIGRANKWIGRRHIPYWVGGSRDITTQINALAKRGLVRPLSYDGTVHLTVAGAFELFFDAGHPA